MSIDINNYEAAVSHALEQDLEIKFPAKFTDEQRRAIAALVRGQGMVAAAKAAGVHRATLRRWIDQGGAFHRFLRQEQGKRLHIQREVVPIADEAAHVVARAIRAGDARTALAMLRALGVFEGVKEDIAAAARDEAREARMSRIRGRLEKKPEARLKRARLGPNLTEHPSRPKRRLKVPSRRRVQALAFR